MKRRPGVLAVAAVAVAGGPIVGGTPGAPASSVANSCGASYAHAVIRGAETCLRQGRFCTRPADRQYRRYQFRCTKRDYTGRYHVT